MLARSEARGRGRDERADRQTAAERLRQARRRRGARPTASIDEPGARSAPSPPGPRRRRAARPAVVAPSADGAEVRPSSSGIDAALAEDRLEEHRADVARRERCVERGDVVRRHEPHPVDERFERRPLRRAARSPRASRSCVRGTNPRARRRSVDLRASPCLRTSFSAASFASAPELHRNTRASSTACGRQAGRRATPAGASSRGSSSARSSRPRPVTAATQRGCACPRLARRGRRADRGRDARRRPRRDTPRHARA